jgi:hypothetical protein
MGVLDTEPDQQRTERWLTGLGYEVVGIIAATPENVSQFCWLDDTPYV